MGLVLIFATWRQLSLGGVSEGSRRAYMTARGPFSQEPTMTVTDNAEHHRFELAEAGAVAFADYRRDGDRLVIPHVEAPDALRGTGAAGRLMEGVVEHARAEGRKIVPVCSYAAAWLKRHSEHADVVA
jgi:predicted GNAT family acetyltransferase